MKLKEEVKISPILFPDVAAWILLATVQEYITCKQSLNKDEIQLLIEFKSGDHIFTSREFRQLCYMCCFGLGQPIFA